MSIFAAQKYREKTHVSEVYTVQYNKNTTMAILPTKKKRKIQNRHKNDTLQYIQHFTFTKCQESIHVPLSYLLN